MPEYLAPGLFIEEIDSGSKPIEGVGTNTVAFFGYAKSGDFNKPTFITNWTQFSSLFGEEENAITKALSQLLHLSVSEVRTRKKASRKGWFEFAQAEYEAAYRAKQTTIDSFRKFLEEYKVPLSSTPYIEGSYLAHAVRGFYDNGGGRAYIIRVARPEDIDDLLYLPSGNGTGANAQPATPAQITAGPLLIKAAQPGAAGNDVKVEIEHVGDGAEFRLKVSQPGKPNEVFPDAKGGFTLEAAAGVVNTKSKIIQLEPAAGVNVATATRPAVATFTLKEGLDGTANLPTTTTSGALVPSLPDGLTSLVANDWIGDTAKRTGLGSIEPIDDIDIVCIPDLMHDVWIREKTTVQEGRQTKTVFKEEKLNPAATLRTREILDTQKALVDYCERAGNRIAILDPLPGLNPQEIDDVTYAKMGNYGCDKGQATLYYPWIRIADPVNKGEQILVPPSGHISGVWARVALERGVHKAPANEVLMGAVGLETEVTKGEQEKLNPNGINCIRAFPGMGIRVWGARTLATVGNPSWKYVNVRRLFNYLEKSMERNLQWVVFEPNDEDLWGRVRRTISAFLYTEWREGKLFGTVPAEAFYVKCDAETNPQETIDLGRMYVEIGINPVKPAEFVIIRMGQWSSGSSIAEQ